MSDKPWKNRVAFTPSKDLEEAIDEMVRRVEEAKGPKLSRATCVEHFAELGAHAYTKDILSLYQKHEEVSKKVRSKPAADVE